MGHNKSKVIMAYRHTYVSTMYLWTDKHTYIHYYMSTHICVHPIGIYVIGQESVFMERNLLVRMST